MKELGKLAAFMIKESKDVAVGVRFTTLDLDNEKVLEKLARAAYENPGHIYGQAVPWEVLEPVDRAIEMDSIRFVLEALVGLVKNEQLEDVKK